MPEVNGDGAAKPVAPLPVPGTEQNAQHAPDAIGAELDAFNADFDASLAADQTAARATTVPVETEGQTAEAADLNAVRDALITTPPAEREKPAADDAAAQQQPAAEAAPAATTPDPNAAPPQAEKPKYDPAERYALADGLEVTRAQIVQGLRERSAWGEELRKFQDVFRVDAATVERTWKPIVDKMIADPGLIDFVDNRLKDYDNAEKRQYIEDCAAHYDTLKGGAPAANAQPQASRLTAEERATLARADQLVRDQQAREQQQAQQNARAAIDAERTNLVKEYPVLGDERLMRIVAQHAYGKLYGGDKDYTLTRAVEDLRDVITRWGGAAPAPAPAAQVPALNGASGAAPAGSRPTPPPPRRRSFANADAALEAWMNEDAPALGYN